ncbi:MAG: hypothetical protein AAGH38_06355 [Pseudomonadota bacterium]
MGRFSESGDAVGSPRLTKPRGNIVVIAIIYIAIQMAFLCVYVGALRWADAVIEIDPFVTAIQSQILALITSLAALVYARQAIDHVYAARAALAGVIVGVALTCGNAIVPFFHERTGSLLDVFFFVNASNFWVFAFAVGITALIVGCFEYTKEGLGEAATGGEDPPALGHYGVMIPVLILLIIIRILIDVELFSGLDKSYESAQLATRLEKGNVVADILFSAPPSAWNLIYSVANISISSFLTTTLAWLSLTPTPPRKRRFIVIGFIFGIWYWTGKK